MTEGRPASGGAASAGRSEPSAGGALGAGSSAAWTPRPV